MDNNALVPDGLELNAEPIIETEEMAINLAESVDKDYAELSLMGGWNRLSADMKSDIDKLRNLKGVDLAGLAMDKVGEKFLVASLVADHLQKYLDKVDNAKKAVANAERAKQPK